MGVDTKGYLRKEILATDVFNVVVSKFDKDAVFNIKKDNDGEIGNILFKFNDEDRRLFYCVSSKDPEDENVLFDGEKNYISLILGYWGNSVHIMTEIVSQFGGYVDENDCDDIEAIYIDINGDFKYSDYVIERQKVISLLDDSLSSSMKIQIASQIIKHKEKLKEVL